MTDRDPFADAIAAAQAKSAQAFTGTKNVVPMRQSSVQGDGPVCVSVTQFLADTAQPDWVVAGIVQRNYLYGLTAPTNHGKTAVSLVMAVCIAAGLPYAGLKTTQGNVLILCGENQDGFRLRLRATMQSLGVSLDDLAGRMFVLPFAAAIESVLAKIQHEAAGFGDLAFVLVDTSVSYFSGADENDNVAAYAHAAMLRNLTMFPGKPAVMANCHPTASSTRERCVPRGGSAFLNEIDTNLMVWADGDTAELHWSTKKRGPDFDPIFWEYKALYIEQHDVKVPTVVAMHITEDRENEIRTKRREWENRLLFAMLNAPHGTIRAWAMECGFTLSTDGKPQTSKVMRLLDRLKEVQYVAHNRRDGWHLTNKGKEEAKTIR